MQMKSPQEELAALRHQSVGEELELSPTTTIDLDVVGERGKRYRHRFKYTVPTLGAMMDIAKLKAQWLPLGSAADINGSQLAEAVAYLTVTIDPSGTPAWFREVWTIHDATPIFSLYKEATSYEARFRGRKSGSDELGGDEDVDEEATGHDAGDRDLAPEGSMGEPVQPPPQRRKTLSSSRG